LPGCVWFFLPHSFEFSHFALYGEMPFRGGHHTLFVGKWCRFGFTHRQLKCLLCGAIWAPFQHLCAGARPPNSSPVFGFRSWAVFVNPFSPGTPSRCYHQNFPSGDADLRFCAWPGFLSCTSHRGKVVKNFFTTQNAVCVYYRAAPGFQVRLFPRAFF